MPVSASLLLPLEPRARTDDASRAQPPLDANDGELMRRAVAAYTGLRIEVPGELLGLNQAMLNEMVLEARHGVALSVKALIQKTLRELGAF